LTLEKTSRFKAAFGFLAADAEQPCRTIPQPPETGFDVLAPFRRLLARRVSGQSLAMVRIGLGLTIIYIVGAFLVPNEKGQTAAEMFVGGAGNACHLPYPGLEWIRPLSEPWMSGVFWACLVVALLFTVGLFYRPSAVALATSFTYLWLTDQTLYGNHFALGSTLALLMIWLPANRCLSLDAWLRRRRYGDSTEAHLVGFWSVFLLRGQVFLIYFFGGLSKLHPDWLSGEPIRMWYRSGMVAERLSHYTGPAVARAAQPWLASEATIHAVAYGGIVFDMTICLLLLLRRTRLLAIMLLVFFHVHNFVLIDRVGVVAPMAFAAATIFLTPDWPGRLLAWLRWPRFHTPDWGWFVLGLLVLPGVGAALGWKLGAAVSVGVRNDRPVSRWRALFIGGWLLFQGLIPLRHFAIAGDAYWTDEGTRLSWFLMTRNKVGDFASFEVCDPRLLVPTGDGRWKIDWSAWRGRRPKITFQEIDARHVPWDDLPRWFVTYEPLLGERVFCKPSATQGTPPAVVTTLITEQWRHRYGGRARAIACRPIEDLLEDLASTATRPGADDRESPLFYALLDRARRYAAAMRDVALTAGAWRRQFRGLVNRLAQMALVTRHPLQLRQQMLATRPFDLQGNREHSEPLYVVVDRKVMKPGKGAMFRLNRTHWPDESREFADLSCMMARHLKPLPKWIVIFSESGPPRILANHAWDLNDSQLRELARMPMVAYAYAQCLANRWQTLYGRRPAVHATAYAQLNHHALQPILDPTVDLARASYSWSSHNDWILPLVRAKPGSTDY